MPASRALVVSLGWAYSPQFALSNDTNDDSIWDKVEKKFFTGLNLFSSIYLLSPVTLRGDWWRGERGWYYYVHAKALNIEVGDIAQPTTSWVAAIYQSIFTDSIIAGSLKMIFAPAHVVFATLTPNSFPCVASTICAVAWPSITMFECDHASMVCNLQTAVYLCS
jgi:hypothetical protein